MPDFRYEASDYWDEHDFIEYEDIREARSLQFSVYHAQLA
jgi:hypothetical protein